jgi:hypothetical protein
MSESKKKILALVGAAVLTLVIVGFWYSLTKDTSNNKNVVTGEDKLSSISPMQVIKDEFSKAFSGFNEATGNVSTTSTSSIPIEIIDEATSSVEISTSTISTTSEKIN